MVATLTKLLFLAVTVVIPGGLLLLPLYLAYRAKQQGRALDFEGTHRRVPATRPPPPAGGELRRTIRKLSRAEAGLSLTGTSGSSR